MASGKFYVVWVGLVPGIYESWDECAQQIQGWKGAVYKAFATREEAERAFADTPDNWIQKKDPAERKKAKKKDKPLPPEVARLAIAVDAACSGNPGPMEYRGVYLQENQEIFKFGPVTGTNNIGEFLAIVHGLSLLKQKGLDWPVYSDSRNAIQWVQKKHCATKLARTPETEPLFQLIERAERWLAANTFSNRIIKWETRQWGEIPADFGRK